MDSTQYPSPIFHSVNPTFLQPHRIGKYEISFEFTKGMSLIEWVTHHLLQAIESSKTTTKITH
ncbi:MAG: hypothetical protein HC903_32555 [Methylacidiphilales bacterium]|nr:hypothetical protein [Candidatus Methylacidiphilales bacterium]NJR19662.1 hypothetical protein [Calothrix sp. CSU_2_0]